MNPYILSLEGNPSTFKSYLISLLKVKYNKHSKNIKFLDEPLHRFSQIHSPTANVENTFELFNKNKKFGLTFQHHIITTLEKSFQDFKNHILTPEVKIVISERHIESCIVFIEYYRQKNIISDIDGGVLLNRINHIIETQEMCRADHLIYLSVNPDLGELLLLNRGRPGEIGYANSKYLTHLNQIHLEIFGNRLDRNQNFDHICDIINHKLGLNQQDINNLPKIQDLRYLIIRNQIPGRQHDTITQK